MKRRFPGLSQAALPTSEVPDGLYLVRAERVQYRWDKQKPYYAVHFTVCDPKPFVGTSLPARLYCTPRAHPSFSHASFSSTSRTLRPARARLSAANAPARSGSDHGD